MSPARTPALERLRAAGIVHQVHEYASPERRGRERDARPAFGDDAVAALGVDAHRVFKTLVAAVDGRLVLAVVPVAGELDLKRLAEACGGRRAMLAQPGAAERATGYVVGGISPIGSRRRLPVVVDSSATTQATVFVSAGRRGLEVELSPLDLARVVQGIVAPIGKIP